MIDEEYAIALRQRFLFAERSVKPTLTSERKAAVKLLRQQKDKEKARRDVAAP